jgi:DNA-binding NtrC family response regulator
MDGTHILIVDDEADAGEILSLRLSRRGMIPAYAPGGEEALIWLARNKADVVLLDIKMPGMDGLETLEHIRKDHPDVSVIILSGHADMSDAARGMELGAFFYLLKPVDLDDLCHKIEDASRQRVLDGQHG